MVPSPATAPKAWHAQSVYAYVVFKFISLNTTTSIASAQSNCNIVGVEHKDGYYFFKQYFINNSNSKEGLITEEVGLQFKIWDSKLTSAN